MKITQTHLIIGGALVLAGAIYFAAKRIKDAADAGADLVAAPIADLISAIIIPPDIVARGGVILPSGKVISWDDVIKGGSYLNAASEFAFQGVKYRVTQKRDDGIYAAVKI
jgi:hypothetical protein